MSMSGRRDRTQKRMGTPALAGVLVIVELNDLLGLLLG